MPKPAAEINEWIRRQELRLGVGHAGNPAGQPTVTVYPGPVVIERLAHYGADKKIAVDQGYDAMCSRTDAMLAEIIEAGIPALPRRKSTRRARVPHVKTND